MSNIYFSFFPKLHKDLSIMKLGRDKLQKNLNKNNNFSELKLKKIESILDQYQNCFNNIYKFTINIKKSLKIETVLPIEKLDKIAHILEFDSFKNADENLKVEILELQKYKIMAMYDRIINTFSEMNIDIEKSSEMQRVRGIKNPGNDCFYISLLQLLAGPEFDPIFHVGEKEKGTIVEKVEYIRRQINNNGQHTPLQPLSRELRRVLNFPDHSQEDITEAFMKLLEVISKTSKEKERLIQELLGIEERNQWKLLEYSSQAATKKDKNGKQVPYPCHEASQFKFNEQKHLVRERGVSSHYFLTPRDIKKHQSLTNWLKETAKPEVATTPLKVYLPEIDGKTKKVREACRIEKNTTFAKLPSILTISPIRKEWDIAKGPVALTDPFRVPQEFTLTDEKGRKKHYELSSFAVQIPSRFSDGGHYYSFRKVGAAWYKINDGAATKIDSKDGFVPQEVIKERHRGYFYIFKEKVNF